LANFRIVRNGPPMASGWTGVHHGRRLVDAAAHLAHDLVDDPAQVADVHEGDGHLVDLAEALHEDLRGAVHHDLGDGRVLQVAVDGPVADHVVGDVADERLGVVQRHGDGLGGQGAAQLVLDAPAQLHLAHVAVRHEGTERLDELVVHLQAQLVEGGVPAQRRGLSLLESLVEGHAATSGVTCRGPVTGPLRTR
jgi:hypothetical protein